MIAETRSQYKERRRRERDEEREREVEEERKRHEARVERLKDAIEIDGIEKVLANIIEGEKYDY